MSSRMPKQKPGRSETVVRTPVEFLTAVKTLLGIDEFVVDLAACADNAVASTYFTKEEDALAQNWFAFGDIDEFGDQWCWLNPPYDDITPWAERCARQVSTFGKCGASVAMLVPASVGSNWWRDYVHGFARVYFLNGRISFLDKHGNSIVSPKTGKPTPYPKDLALLLYGNEPGYDVWEWRKQA